MLNAVNVIVEELETYYFLRVIFHERVRPLEGETEFRILDAILTQRPTDDRTEVPFVHTIENILYVNELRLTAPVIEVDPDLVLTEDRSFLARITDFDGLDVLKRF